LSAVVLVIGGGDPIEEAQLRSSGMYERFLDTHESSCPEKCS